MNEIEKFDPSTLMQGVRDRIKSTFVSLIPDEQWEHMVKKEINDFFKEKDINGYCRTQKSDFQLVCREIINELAKEKTKEEMKEYECEMWKDGKALISEKLKCLIIENSPEILASIVSNQFQIAINSMRTEVNN